MDRPGVDRGTGRGIGAASKIREQRQHSDIGELAPREVGSGDTRTLLASVWAAVQSDMGRAASRFKLSESELTIGSVCARGGSKGVPRKNLRPLYGRPLIAYALEQAQQSQAFDRIVTSTDDPEIAATALELGAEVPFLRPAHLAQDTSSKWYVFRHLVTELERQGSGPIGIVADLDTGAALRTPEDICACVAKLVETGADVCVTAYEADHNPYYNMVEMDAAGIARVCQPPAVPITNRQQAPPVYNLSPSIFAIRRSALFTTEHWSRCRMALSVIPRDRAVDIDTEFDFQLVEFLLGRRLGAR